MGRVDGISLHHGDRCARFTNGRMVYHDDIGDYSTNEPIMDGTANTTYLMSILASRSKRWSLRVDVRCRRFTVRVVGRDVAESCGR